MSRTWLVKLVSLSGGSLKTNFSTCTQYNICKSGKLVDQWSDYCTITSIKSKIYMHNSFSGKAAQRTFQTRNEIHRHFAIVGRTIRRLVKVLAFVLLSGGSFKSILAHADTYNICGSDSLEDQWSNHCTVTLI